MKAIINYEDNRYEREIISITYTNSNLVLITKDGDCLTYSKDSLDNGFITIS